LAHTGHKQSFDSKENNFNQANLKSRIGAKENIKNCLINNKNKNEKTSMNKSIEIVKQDDHN